MSTAMRRWCRCVAGGAVLHGVMLWSSAAIGVGLAYDLDSKSEVESPMAPLSLFIAKVLGFPLLQLERDWPTSDMGVIVAALAHSLAWGCVLGSAAVLLVRWSNRQLLPPCASPVSSPP
jgi:hypothetical protein